MDFKKLSTILFFALALSISGSMVALAKLGGGQNKKVDNACKHGVHGPSPGRERAQGWGALA